MPGSADAARLQLEPQILQAEISQTDIRDAEFSKRHAIMIGDRRRHGSTGSNVKGPEVRKHAEQKCGRE